MHFFKLLPAKQELKEHRDCQHYP